ncbi:MAG: ABC transporter permease subunit [Clostridia bacterium]|nr:ABC transporter permease subunit [Clostridia bacterium]
MIAIFKREFKAYFTSPLGYLVIAVLALFEGLSFIYMYAAGYAENEYVLTAQTSWVAIAIPVLTMRLFSEERRQKTDQVLLTSPVSLWGIVFGKFLASFAVFAIGFAPTFIYQMILTTKVEALNWLLYLGALFGMMLYGAALIAICMFISALTESQVVAAVISLVVSMVLINIDSLAQMTGFSFIINLSGYLSFLGRYNAFYMGYLDFSNIVYFASVAFLFMFLSVRMLEKKRWA